MSIDDTLDAIERGSVERKQLTPLDAVEFLKSIPQAVSLVNFVCYTPKDDLAKIGSAIRAIKQGFIDDCDADPSLETDTVKAMRNWPDIMTFIERWAEHF
jgi:hypothetical protein